MANVFTYFILMHLVVLWMRQSHFHLIIKKKAIHPGLPQIKGLNLVDKHVYLLENYQPFSCLTFDNFSIRVVFVSFDI